MVTAPRDAAAIRKMVYKTLHPPQVLFMRLKCVHGKPDVFIC